MKLSVGDIIQWPNAKGYLKHAHGIVIKKTLYDITIHWLEDIIVPRTKTYGTSSCSYPMNHQFKAIS